ncbi:MAG: Rieske (2Fe-2S) protein [Acidimicrobiales bacterium]
MPGAPWRPRIARDEFEVGCGRSAGVLILGGAAAEVGALINDAPKPTKPNERTLKAPTTTTTTPDGSTTAPPTPVPDGAVLGTAADVPDNSAAAFRFPPRETQGIIIHAVTGDFVAYNAVCPHMGCTVGYSRANKIIICPCHGSQFEVSNGEVIIGPAPHGLTKLKIAEGTNGNLYLQ